MTMRTLPPLVGLLPLLLGCRAEPSPPSSPSSDPPAPRAFVETTLAFRYESDRSEEKRMYETMGGGAVLFDADADGALDLYLPGGGAAGGAREATTHQAFFRGDGRGGFVDATAEAGLEAGKGSFAFGGAADDVDGDGDLDLYVAGLGPNRLYLNDGRGVFEEVPDAGGATAPGWTSTAVFFDADGDGDPDLYAVGYVEYDRAEELPCTLGGERDYCVPDLFAAEPDRFYLNEGGRFRDASAESGVGSVAVKGLAATALDVDRDGDLDVFVAADTTPNLLWINDGTGRFSEEGLLRGVGLGRHGEEKAGMGVVGDDLDGDGDADFVVTAFSGENYDLYLSESGEYFHESGHDRGFVAATRGLLGFGVVTADLDADGLLDLVFANGHIFERAGDILLSTAYRQPQLVLRNTGRDFEPWAEIAGDLGEPAIARGLAAADLDGDGDVDLVASRLDDPSAVYLLEGAPPRPPLVVRPVDGRGMPSWGTTIEIATASERRIVRYLAAGGSYASQSEPVVRQWLPQGDAAVSVDVVWPGGVTGSFPVEGDGEVLAVRPVPTAGR